jgi:hypothetical protein
MTYLNLFTIYLLKKYFLNDLNLGNILTSQMDHHLPIKMMNQIVSYSTNKKDHPNHNGGFKWTCLD